MNGNGSSALRFSAGAQANTIAVTKGRLSRTDVISQSDIAAVRQERASDGRTLEF
jgi:hypothetical protein